MLSISNPAEATLLQLQYTADSCGLRRTYNLTSDLNDDLPKTVKASKSDSSQWTEDIVSRARCYLKPGEKATDGPDIEWYPSYETYQARVKNLASLEHNRPTSVPPGWPEVFDAPRVWSGADFADPQSYTMYLTQEDVLEIEDALAYFKVLPGHNGPDQVSRETFPLPKLQSKLQEISLSVHQGIGFSVLRGLDPSKYTPLDNVLLYLGITSYVAEQRGAQDYDGKMILHLKDVEKDLPGETTVPSPYTNRAQPFHNDRCDILAMYAINVASNGGESLLASAGKVYNEIAASRPDVIHVLSDGGWVFDKFVKPAKWVERPLLYNFPGNGPAFCYSRRPLTGARFSPHMPGVPAMSEVQAEALDMVQFTAADHQLAIKLERGDIEFVNNFALFHSRRGFEDDVSQRRHYIRLWLRNNELAWDLPEELKQQSFELYDESSFRRNGRWDIEKAAFVPKVLEAHMDCS